MLDFIPFDFDFDFRLKSEQRERRRGERERERVLRDGGSTQVIREKKDYFRVA